MEPGSADAVLLTGVYGVGKTSVAEEIAEVFERRGTPFAALDLDWLAWFDAGWDDDEAEFRMMLENTSAVVADYLSAGIRFFVLALSVESAEEVAGIRGVPPMSMRVVRLTAEFDTIEERLRGDVTAGRQVDLRWAKMWLEEGTGIGFEDFTVAYDRPVRDVALEIMAGLGWA